MKMHKSRSNTIIHVLLLLHFSFSFSFSLFTIVTVISERENVLFFSSAEVRTTTTSSGGSSALPPVLLLHTQYKPLDFEYKRDSPPQDKTEGEVADDDDDGGAEEEEEKEEPSGLHLLTGYDSD